jgi:hypothetical protein
MTDPKIARMLEFVASCEDPAKLRQIAANASGGRAPVLERAARLKLYAVLPAEQPGTVDHAVWQSIYALEDVLRQERGKTILLSRTRQKIARQGVIRCVADLVAGSASDGFRMLLERDMLDLSFEAVALRFPDAFDAAVLEAARIRLVAAGYRG